MMNKFKSISDNELLDDLMYWVAIYRNQGKLSDKDRKYFKRLCSEIGKRKLLK